MDFVSEKNIPLVFNLSAQQFEVEIKNMVRSGYTVYDCWFLIAMRKDDRFTAGCMKVRRNKHDRTMVVSRIRNTVYHEPGSFSYMKFPNEMTLRQLWRDRPCPTLRIP